MAMAQAVMTMTQTIAQLPAAAGTGSSPTAKPADPERFNGERGQKAYDFLAHLNLIFDYFPTRFADHLDRIRYAVLYMKDSAFGWAQQVMVATPTPNPVQGAPVLNVYLHPAAASWQAFESAFLDLYGDPARIATATRQLIALKQGTGTVTQFAAEFVRLKTIAQWNDAACCALFQHGLSRDVQDALSKSVIIPAHDAFNDWVTIAIRVDNQRRAFTSANPTNTPRLPRNTAGQFMPATAESQVDADGDTLMGGLTKQQRFDLKNKDTTCFKCQQKGHLSSDRRHHNRSGTGKSDKFVTAKPQQPVQPRPIRAAATEWIPPVGTVVQCEDGVREMTVDGWSWTPMPAKN